MRARRQLLMARNKTHLLFGSMLRATGWLHVSLQQLVVEQEICLLIAVLSMRAIRQLLMARNKTHTTINGTAVTGDMSVDCRDDYACAEATINGAEQNTFVICNGTEACYETTINGTAVTGDMSVDCRD
eukprot:87718_1